MRIVPTIKSQELFSETFPYLPENRLIVLPGGRLSREEVTVIERILNMERLIQVKLFSKPLHHLRGELGSSRGFTWLGFPGAKWITRNEITDTKKRVTIF